MKEPLKQISNHVERFERNIEAYHSSAYNETQLRIEFIDPFFEALGWDVTNKAGARHELGKKGNGAILRRLVHSMFCSKMDILHFLAGAFFAPVFTTLC